MIICLPKGGFILLRTELSKQTLDIFKILCENGQYYGDIRWDGEDITLDVASCAAYDIHLTLKDVSGVPEKFDCLCLTSDSFAMSGDTYSLTGEYDIWDDDKYQPFTITFTDAVTDIRIYDANKETFTASPWLYLLSIGCNILDKYYLPGDYFNEKERALLPLLGEICQLSYWARVPEEYQNLQFPLLKELLESYGYTKLIAPLDVIAREYENYKKINGLKDSYMAKLNSVKYEPLWRHLFNLIVDSQAEYAPKVDCCYSDEILNEKRDQIQKLMEAHSYTGTYPDFTKQGSMLGIHLAESYDVSYFVGLEKNVVYNIHCTEEYFNDHLMIQFLCGTERLGRKATPKDIYYCTFNTKGHTFSNSVAYECDFLDENGNKASHDLV